MKRLFFLFSGLLCFVIFTQNVQASPAEELQKEFIAGLTGGALKG